MKKIFLVILSVLLISSGCKKEKPETVTVNGITFGCKVNGKQFIPDKWDYGLNFPPIRVYFLARSNNALDLLLQADKQNEYIQIFLNRPLYQGRHDLKFYTMSFPIYDPPKDNGVFAIEYPHQEFITNENIGGYVDLIEIDTVHMKVYGEFEFTGTDRFTGKQVKVTDGVFKNY
jgi:hypothetical protein